MDYVTATAIASLSILLIGMAVCLYRLVDSIHKMNDELMRD